RAGVFLGLGIVLKLSPVVVLIPWLARERVRRQWRPLAAGLLVTMAPVYALAWWLGWLPIGSLYTFFTHWSFGSPLVTAPQTLGGDSFARALTAAAIPLGAAWLWSRRRELATDTMRALGLIFLFSPVVYSWYLVPLAVLFPFSALPTVGLWIAAHPMTYEVID